MMNKFVSFSIISFALFLSSFCHPQFRIQDPFQSNGISNISPTNENQIYLQTVNQQTGENMLMEKGPRYKVNRDPMNGLADLYPTPPPNFVTGVTPLHMTYQYITYPQRISTPLNQFAYPRVHVPIYGLDHPMNLHHPYNNVFGMQTNMFTGAPAARPSLFMNPSAYGSSLMPQAPMGGMQQGPMGGMPSGPMGGMQQNPNAPGGMNSVMNNGLSNKISSETSGFNPSMTGVGPYGAGSGAFNQSQSPMSNWFYLSPFNAGSDSHRTI